MLTRRPLPEPILPERGRWIPLEADGVRHRTGEAGADVALAGRFGEDVIRHTVIPRTLVGRLGRHEEICTALIFLASDAGGYVTGITLPVEGGMLAT